MSERAGWDHPHPVDDAEDYVCPECTALPHEKHPECADPVCHCECHREPRPITPEEIAEAEAALAPDFVCHCGEEMCDGTEVLHEVSARLLPKLLAERTKLRELLRDIRRERIDSREDAELYRRTMEALR